MLRPRSRRTPSERSRLQLAASAGPAAGVVSPVPGRPPTSTRRTRPRSIQVPEGERQQRGSLFFLNDPAGLCLVLSAAPVPALTAAAHVLATVATRTIAPPRLVAEDGAPAGDRVLWVGCAARPRG